MPDARRRAEDSFFMGVQLEAMTRDELIGALQILGENAKKSLSDSGRVLVFRDYTDGGEGPT